MYVRTKRAQSVQNKPAQHTGFTLFGLQPISLRLLMAGCNVDVCPVSSKNRTYIYIYTTLFSVKYYVWGLPRNSSVKAALLTTGVTIIKPGLTSPGLIWLYSLSHSARSERGSPVSP